MVFCFLCVFGLGFCVSVVWLVLRLVESHPNPRYGFHDNHKLWTSGRVAKDEEKKANAFILTRHAGYFQPKVIVFFACHTLDSIYIFVMNNTRCQ